MNTKPLFAKLGVGLVAMLTTVTCLAQSTNYAINWWTIDGGGGTSTGGIFTLTGTIGQPDAGRIAGGAYQLDGGFWGIVAAVQTPGAPLLTVQVTNNVARIFWPIPATGFVLDHAGALNGSPIGWGQVSFPYQTNATHIFITVPQPAGDRFYRLRKP
jgi:hypothetical protein